MKEKKTERWKFKCYKWLFALTKDIYYGAIRGVGNLPGYGSPTRHRLLIIFRFEEHSTTPALRHGDHFSEALRGKRWNEVASGGKWWLVVASGGNWWLVVASGG